MLKLVKAFGTNRAMRRLLHNSVSLIASNLLGAALGVAIPLLIGRSLGAARFGVWTFSMTWASLLMMICTLGPDQLLTREAAKLHHQSNQLLLNGLCAKLAIFIVPGVAIFLAAPLLAIDPESSSVLRIAVIIAATGAAYSSFVAIFRAFEWTAPVLWLNVGGLVIQLLGVVVILHLGGDIFALAWLALTIQIARVGVAMLLWNQRIRSGHGKMTLSTDLTARTIRQSMPLAVTGIVNATQTQSIPLILGYLRSSIQVGWFSAAIRISETVRLIPGGGLSAVYPMFSGTQGSDRHFFRTFNRTLIAFSFVLALGVVAFARPAIELVLGPSYLSAVPVLLLLGVDLVPAMISFSAITYLLASGEEAYVIKVQAIGVAIQIASSVPLILAFGATGGAMAILLGRVVICLPLSLRANAMNAERSFNTYLSQAQTVRRNDAGSASEPT